MQGVDIWHALFVVELMCAVYDLQTLDASVTPVLRSLRRCARVASPVLL